MYELWMVYAGARTILERVHLASVIRMAHYAIQRGFTDVQVFDPQGNPVDLRANP